MRYFIFSLIFCVGCTTSMAPPACLSSDQVARANILSRVLRSDNHLFLSRQPELVEHKLARLEADPYDFMRGTIALWFYDVQNIGTVRPQLVLTETIAQRTTMLIGDPHPENLSTAFASGSTLANSSPQLALEWIDLDSVTTGAFHLDLRRATMGLALFFGGTTACNQDCVHSVSDALLKSYRGAVFQAERARPVLAPPLGKLWSNLATEARLDPQGSF